MAQGAPYWVAQVLGCFVGAALVFLVYNNAINHFDQVNHIMKGQPASVATYSTFATFPAPYFNTVWGPLIDQIVGTFFLALFVCAVTDEFNLPVGANIAPVDRRHDRDGGRHLVWRERRLRDQPGP